MPAHRWTLVEYGLPRGIVAEISAASGLSQTNVKGLFHTAGERVASLLGMSAAPITVDRDQVRAVDIAGLIRLAPGIEIEIAPKFLGDDATDTRWREDFFYLANLSKHGKILASERLHAGRAAARDLPALVARSVVEMHRDNSRRPLRTYRHVDEWDFALDGDVNPESVVLPSADGFEQTTIRYGRHNVYNSTIKAAAHVLQAEVTDSVLQRQLGRVTADLGPQAAMRSPRRRKLPSRSRRWQDLHDLSVDVLQGLGLVFDPRKPAHTPGYIVSTWQVWEDFLTLAARLAYSAADVRPQHSIVLGTRVRLQNDIETETNLTVTPDLALLSSAFDAPPVLLDAKYKTRASVRRQRIDEADIYESLAFAQAAKTQTVVLLYPAVPTEAAMQLGSVTPFEKVFVGGVVIHGLQVDVRGISGSGALRLFATNLADGIDKALSVTDNGDTAALIAPLHHGG
jgi:5-methylcytosine-specific restriction enzyme subunit McrC